MNVITKVFTSRCRIATIERDNVLPIKELGAKQYNKEDDN